MKELKPCPFCGAKMNFDSSGALFAWHKSDCFLQLLVNHQMDMAAGKNRKFVVMAWNRRYENDA